MALNLISLAWGVRDGLRLHATELEALQLQRLRRLLDHSYENVPYYRLQTIRFERRNSLA